MLGTIVEAERDRNPSLSATFRRLHDIRTAFSRMGEEEAHPYRPAPTGLVGAVGAAIPGTVGARLRPVCTRAGGPLHRQVDPRIRRCISIRPP